LRQFHDWEQIGRLATCPGLGSLDGSIRGAKANGLPRVPAAPSPRLRG
jgi:hypothetical protein